MSQGLQRVNTTNKLAEWAELVGECRSSGQTVKAWCKERGICEQTYYRWQRRLYELSQQESRFAEISLEPVRRGSAIRVRIGSAEAEIPSGTDAATIETVLRVMQRC